MRLSNPRCPAPGSYRPRICYALASMFSYKMENMYLTELGNGSSSLTETSMISEKRHLRRDHLAGLALRRPSGGGIVRRPLSRRTPPWAVKGQSSFWSICLCSPSSLPPTVFSAGFLNQPRRSGSPFEIARSFSIDITAQPATPGSLAARRHCSLHAALATTCTCN